jgi:hypothetical protein
VQRHCRSVGVKESFEDSGAKLRRDSIIIHAGKTQCYRVHRGKKAKVEAFEHLKFFQVWEERAQAQEEQQLPSDDPKRSGPLKVFTSREQWRSA